jgi:hypothetical protein
MTKKGTPDKRTLLTDILEIGYGANIPFRYVPVECDLVNEIEINTALVSFLFGPLLSSLVTLLLLTAPSNKLYTSVTLVTCQLLTSPLNTSVSEESK